jgi:hypothetical protein
MQIRAVHIDKRTVKYAKKWEYYFFVLDYPYRPGKPSKKLYPTAFKKTFPTRKEAYDYAVATIKKLNDRYKHTRYLTRFLND